MRDLNHAAWVNSHRCYTPRELTHAGLLSLLFSFNLLFLKHTKSFLHAKINYNIKLVIEHLVTTFLKSTCEESPWLLRKQLARVYHVHLGCMTHMDLSLVGDHKEELFFFFFIIKMTFKCDNNILINRKFQNWSCI